MERQVYQNPNRRQDGRRPRKESTRPARRQAYDYEEDEGSGRPPRRGPNKARLGCLVVLVLLVAALIGVGVAGMQIVNEVTGEGSHGAEVTLYIEQGSGPQSIAQNLKDSGLIRWPSVFRLYLKQKGAAGSLQYGEFTLYKGMSYDEIIEVLTTTVNRRATTTVTFPEGITAIQFAQRMEQAGLCTVQEFLDCANGVDGSDFSQYEFWNQIPNDPDRFMRAEGYLSPNTYEFYTDDSVYNYVDKLYGQFDSTITPELKARMAELGMTLDETVILASFVQEEAGNAESAHVSAVFHNRLADDSPFPRLESNVSSYVENPNDNNYLYNWVAPYLGGWDVMMQEHKNIYDAYNTYERVGLPAGPVSNPGIGAIEAALWPDQEFLDEKYYFFVTDKNGKYYYGKTTAEHAANCNTAFSVS